MQSQTIRYELKIAIRSNSLTRHIRLKQMNNSANFQNIDYLLDKSQFIAYSSGQFATYFDALKGKQLREVELSYKEIFDIAVDPTGLKFSLVRADQLVKLFDQGEGKITHIGHGHSDPITFVVKRVTEVCPQVVEIQ
ncbi:MAG: hypothetical protein EZS28_026622 [Streblomastix strix]|uniref:Uncharacterized protein n=1 Tax=Streblomastix strix TaxID=222440 RepID=A0A5J4V6R0_9EUKA|nr:MAG: hypothetical protein EZS28_026622 [Streblomastix strix]